MQDVYVNYSISIADIKVIAKCIYQHNMQLQLQMEMSSESLYGGSSGVKTFAKKNKKDALMQAFVYPALKAFLEAEAPGKKVLDIGCGSGDWARLAVECGAKSVDGFDIQEGMVELAQQATAQYSSVKICVGDVMDMPYDDNTFDVAISILVTCNLPIEALTKHFEELNRVLAPGGKALVLNLSNPAFQTLSLITGADEMEVKEKIDHALKGLPNFPSQFQINKALKDLDEVLRACFAKDEQGSVFLVENVYRLVIGQAVWSKTQILPFPNYFYDDQFITDITIASGLHIDHVENFCTEERRIDCNMANPEARISKTVTDNPYALMYHVSKSM